MAMVDKWFGKISEQAIETAITAAIANEDTVVDTYTAAGGATYGVVDVWSTSDGVSLVDMVAIKIVDRGTTSYTFAQDESNIEDWLKNPPTTPNEVRLNPGTLEDFLDNISVYGEIIITEANADHIGACAILAATDVNSVITADFMRDLSTRSLTLFNRASEAQLVINALEFEDGDTEGTPITPTVFVDLAALPDYYIVSF